MIKRAYIFIILAILCAFSVLGTGFALWSFEKQSVATQNLGVHVTQSAVLGRFETPEIKFVVLDGGTGAGINPTITGVSFYKEDNNKAVTDNAFTISFTVNEVYENEISEANSDRVRFGIRIDVPKSLAGLITHTDFYNSHLGTDGYIDLKALAIELTDHFGDADYSKSDFQYVENGDGTGDVFTFALSTTTLNRFFTYLPTNEPTTLENYEKLGQNYAPDFVIELWQGYEETE